MGTHERRVAPFTGAWIEMMLTYQNGTKQNVAPFTGAWIEIESEPLECQWLNGRSLYGSVD